MIPPEKTFPFNFKLFLDLLFCFILIIKGIDCKSQIIYTDSTLAGISKAVVWKGKIYFLLTYDAKIDTRVAMIRTPVIILANLRWWMRTVTIFR